MKRYTTIWILALLMSLLSGNSLSALGDDTTAYYEERIRVLSSRVEELTQAHTSLVEAINKLQRQNNILKEELLKVREIAKTPAPAPDLSSAASLESVKQLQAALVALENRFLASEKDRQRDNERILNQLEKLAKIAPSGSVPTKPKPAVTTPEPEIIGNGTVYEWTVKEGETLSSIVKTVKNSGGTTSVNAILKANPGLNPNTLRVGRKINVPDIGK